MKRLLQLALFLICFVAIERFCHKQTRGFSPHKISSTPLFIQEKLPPENLRALLSQPYRFLGDGGQCYAFLSEDGSTVLKFFKQHHIRFWDWISALSLPSFLKGYREEAMKKHAHHTSFVLESCQIASSDFKERTGILCFYRAGERKFSDPLIIFDNLGIAHPIDLNKTDFVLQKKVEKSHTTIKRLMEAHEIEEGKKCIDSLLQLAIERCKKGIKDRDPNIRTNFGFIGTTAIEMDVGSFSYDATLKDPSHYRTELHRQTFKFEKWLEVHSPELYIYLIARRESALE